MSGVREGNTHKNCRIWVLVATKTAPPSKTPVERGIGAPICALHEGAITGFAGDSIGLDNTLALFGARGCEPRNNVGPQIAIGTAIGAASGDALGPVLRRTTPRELQWACLIQRICKTYE
jgi:hypothetical protein